MSFDEVKPAAARWFADFGLPAEQRDSSDRTVKDLKGRFVRVCSFLTEQDLQFFFPKRTVPFQNRMVKEVTAGLRKRGASIQRVVLNAHSYARWLQNQEDTTDTPARRYVYATRPPHT